MYLFLSIFFVSLASASTELEFAIFRGKIKAVRKILESGSADINAKYPTTGNEKYPLIDALYSKHFDVAKMMIEEFGADVNVRDADGFRPIDIAVFHCEIELVELIMDLSGDKIDVNEIIHGTPLIFRAISGFSDPRKCRDVTQIVIKHGADLTSRFPLSDEKHNQLATPLMHAAAMCRFPQFEAILQASEDEFETLYETDELGNTVAHIMAINPRDDMCLPLAGEIISRVDPDFAAIENNNGKTAEELLYKFVKKAIKHNVKLDPMSLKSGKEDKSGMNPEQILLYIPKELMTTFSVKELYKKVQLSAKEQKLRIERMKQEMESAERQKESRKQTCGEGKTQAEKQIDTYKPGYYRDGTLYSYQDAWEDGHYAEEPGYGDNELELPVTEESEEEVSVE